jgi:hypothetical protein
VLKLLIVVAVLAFAIYWAIRLLQGNDDGPGRQPAKPTRPIAPDDDPEFLRDLDRRRRRSDESDS